MSEAVQLELFLGEYGQSAAHIAKLEKETGVQPRRPAALIASAARYPQVKHEPVELVPWPKHMRFD